MMFNILFALLALAVMVSAFPGMPETGPVFERQTFPGLAPFPEYPGKPSHAAWNNFDPVKQKIKTTGNHAFVPPGPGDMRGPCPALNAAANHNYIPHDGIIYLKDVAEGLNEAFNFGLGPATVISSIAALFDGDPLTGRFSIGFHSSKTSSLNILGIPVGDLLGNETGICAYGHNHIESDASITRGDWLAPTQNSNCAAYPEFAQQLLDTAVRINGPSGQITSRVLAEHSHIRRAHSISTNPNYFSPPFAGFFVNFAAHMFAFNIMSNRSAEHPRGYLSPKSFMSLWSFTKDSQGNLVYKYGHERIPDNYYKSSAADVWEVDDIIIATIQRCQAYPEDCEIGGNTGTVNSFVGIQIGHISNGVFDATALTDPAKLACFLAQTVQAEAPTFLSHIFELSLLHGILSNVSPILTKGLSWLGTCPGLPQGRSVFSENSIFPGARINNKGQRNPF